MHAETKKEERNSQPAHQSHGKRVHLCGGESIFPPSHAFSEEGSQSSSQEETAAVVNKRACTLARRRGGDGARLLN
jgi:hypothetical protein